MKTRWRKKFWWAGGDWTNSFPGDHMIRGFLVTDRFWDSKSLPRSAVAEDLSTSDDRQWLSQGLATQQSQHAEYWVLSRVTFGIINCLPSTCCTGINHPKLKTFNMSAWAPSRSLSTKVIFAKCQRGLLWVLSSLSTLVTCLSYLSMTRVPAFNILALGLKSKTHSLIQGLLDPLFKTLYTVSMLLQIFLFLSAVYPVYWFAFEPSHSIVVFRIGCFCLRDKHNNKCFWDPRSNLGMFYRQYQHRLVYCAIVEWKQLDHVWQYPVTKWTPCAHRESKRFESANFLVRSDSVQFSFQRNASTYRFKKLGNTV